MLSAEGIKQAVALGREQRSVEFKAPGSRKDRHLCAKVIRAVVGMANLRDGGHVLVGISDDAAPGIAGLSEADAATWTHDAFRDSLDQYADPFVECSVVVVEVDQKFVCVIEVTEFEEIPVVCRRDYSDVLQEGALYVRARRKPETVSVRSHADMRDVLELATTKGIRRFLGRAVDAGVSLDAQDRSAAQYDDELRDVR